MTTIETWMKRFNAEASPCKAHGVRPVYSYDGIHSIECGSGCVMIDSENATLMKIMERWELQNDQKDQRQRV